MDPPPHPIRPHRRRCQHRLLGHRPRPPPPPGAHPAHQPRPARLEDSGARKLVLRPRRNASPPALRPTRLRPLHAQPANLSLEALVEDIPAVIEATDGGPVTIVSFGGAITLSLAFANRYPQAVDGVVVGNPAPVPDRLARIWRAIDPLADIDWPLFTQTWAHIATGFDSNHSPPLANAIQEGATPDSYRAWLDLWLDSDPSVPHRSEHSPTPYAVAVPQASSNPSPSASD